MDYKLMCRIKDQVVNELPGAKFKAGDIIEHATRKYKVLGVVARPVECAYIINEVYTVSESEVRAWTERKR